MFLPKNISMANCTTKNTGLAHNDFARESLRSVLIRRQTDLSIISSPSVNFLIAEPADSEHRQHFIGRRVDRSSIYTTNEIIIDNVIEKNKKSLNAKGNSAACRSPKDITNIFRVRVNENLIPSLPLALTIKPAMLMHLQNPLMAFSYLLDKKNNKKSFLSNLCNHTINNNKSNILISLLYAIKNDSANNDLTNTILDYWESDINPNAYNQKTKSIVPKSGNSLCSTITLDPDLIAKYHLIMTYFRLDSYKHTEKAEGLWKSLGYISFVDSRFNSDVKSKDALHYAANKVNSTADYLDSFLFHNTIDSIQYAALNPTTRIHKREVFALTELKTKKTINKDLVAALIDYSKKVINGRWPELEDVLLEKVDALCNAESYESALDYWSQHFSGSKWPQLEEKLLKLKCSNPDLAHATIFKYWNGNAINNHPTSENLIRKALCFPVPTSPSDIDGLYAYAKSKSEPDAMFERFLVVDAARRNYYFNANSIEVIRLYLKDNNIKKSIFCEAAITSIIKNTNIFSGEHFNEFLNMCGEYFNGSQQRSSMVETAISRVRDKMGDKLKSQHLTTSEKEELRESIENLSRFTSMHQDKTKCNTLINDDESMSLYARIMISFTLYSQKDLSINAVMNDDFTPLTELRPPAKIITRFGGYAVPIYKEIIEYRMNTLESSGIKTPDDLPNYVLKKHPNESAAFCFNYNNSCDPTDDEILDAKAIYLLANNKYDSKIDIADALDFAERKILDKYEQKPIRKFTPIELIKL